MRKEFTATAYIFDEERTLLIYHKKHQKWLPPGGHLELNELPSEAAVREAFEETGLHIELFQEENIWVDKRENCESFQRPYMCLLENIPARSGAPEHKHVDFIYVGRPVGGELFFNEKETRALKWFSFEEILLLKKDTEIFGDTMQILTALFSSLRDKLSPFHQLCEKA